MASSSKKKRQAEQQEVDDEHLKLEKKKKSKEDEANEVDDSEKKKHKKEKKGKKSKKEENSADNADEEVDTAKEKKTKKDKRKSKKNVKFNKKQKKNKKKKRDYSSSSSSSSSSSDDESEAEDKEQHEDDEEPEIKRGRKPVDNIFYSSALAEQSTDFDDYYIKASDASAAEGDDLGILDDEAKDSDADDTEAAAAAPTPATTSTHSRDNDAKTSPAASGLQLREAVNQLYDAIANNNGDNFLSAALQRTFPDRERVKKVIKAIEKKKNRKQASEDFVQCCSALSLRIANLIKQFHSKSPVSVEDIKTTNEDLPLADKYTQIQLWDQILRENQKLAQSMDAILMKKKEDDASTSSTKAKETAPSAAAADISCTGNKQQKSVSKTFRDYYVNEFTKSFGEELDAIRRSPYFSAAKVSTLIDCMESGMDLFDSFEQQMSVQAISRRN